MKTLEEVKEQYAKEMGFDSWEELEDMQTKNAVSKHWGNAAKIFAIETAKEALNIASKNAHILTTRGAGYTHRSVSKESILNENNIPKI